MVKDLAYQGINRTTSDYAPGQSCEELINLRPTNTGLVPVKPFSVKIESTAYSRIFVHKAGVDTNYIGVKISGTNVLFDRIGEDGAYISPIDTLPFGESFTLDSISFAYTGNIALFSIVDESDDTPIYTNYAFLWENDTYRQLQADIPQMNTSVSILDVAQKSFPGAYYDDSNTQEEIIDILNSGLNAVQEQNKEYCFGPTIIAIAYKTTDGNTFWTGKWFLVDPMASVRSQTYYYVDSTWDSGGYFSSFFAGNTYGCLVGMTNSTDDKSYTRAVGIKVQMILGQVTWDEDTSILKSVEVYATRPKLYIDPANKYGQTSSSYSPYTYTLLATLPYAEMELDNQLFYLQKSVPLADLKNGAYTFTLEFGGNKQTTGKTLEVDTGAVTRAGKLLAYNARFHYYDSVSTTLLSMPDFGLALRGLDEDEPWHVIVHYDDGDTDSNIFLGNITSVANLPSYISTVIAPTLHIKEVVLYAEISGYYKLYKYAMRESQRYNYSICDTAPFFYDNTTATAETQKYAAIVAGGGGSSAVLRRESSAINVTEQYNPFVFRVEHSYLAPGAVLDVQPQMVAVTDVSYGDYPLNVFTNRGVYALLQGNGTVLYGAFRPVSNLVSTSNSMSTESGTFFLAAGGLWMVAGSHAVLVSDALSLGPHTYIRSCSGYQGIAVTRYNVSSYLSTLSFEDYVAGATLSYNRYRDELIISNSAKSYSYVLSLKYRQWFKISSALHQDCVGESIAWEGTSIVDFSDEQEGTTTLVHLQTRPFSFGYQYTHVHRLIAMVRAALSDEVDIQTLTLGLYGSDDLQDWTLISYADRQNKTFSQIRTPSAGRSWRYYTITLGGPVPIDTDFGPFLVDYEPVIRRIG